MTDRRRVNGPSGGTAPPVFASSLNQKDSFPLQRSRAPNELRKIFLKTGLTLSASGSAYFELEPSVNVEGNPSPESRSAIKLSCTVHGPRPLPRSAPFSPQLLLSTRVKFAPFAARQRKGYIPDAGERDLAAHLETALRGVLICERWPKSGIDVVVTVLEGEEDGSAGGWGMMSVLSGCVTVASAAVADAGIDCVDLMTGGIAAIVRQPSTSSLQTVLDPCPSEHEEIIATCVVGYLQSLDEVTEIWARGNIEEVSTDPGKVSVLGFESLVDRAVEAASAARLVLVEAMKEHLEVKIRSSGADRLENSALS